MNARLQIEIRIVILTRFSYYIVTVSVDTFSSISVYQMIFLYLETIIILYLVFTYF